MERYETKLSVMAFIGVFDELMRTVMPVRLLLSERLLIECRKTNANVNRFKKKRESQF